MTQAPLMQSPCSKCGVSLVRVSTPTNLLRPILLNLPNHFGAPHVGGLFLSPASHRAGCGAECRRLVEVGLKVKGKP